MDTDDAPTVGMVYPSLGHRPTLRSSTEYGHPAHRGFARAVDADDLVVQFRHLPGPLRDTLLTDVVSAAVATLPERDVFVIENDAVLYAAPFLRRRHPDATIVHLAAADRLLGRTYVRRPDAGRVRAATRRANGLLDTPFLQRILTRYCDGAVAVSEFARDRVRSFAGVDFPVRVATPYVQPGPYATLGAVEPDLSTPVAVTVGECRDHKGVDKLVEAWPRVRDRHPDAELRIVGRGYPPEYADVLGVALRGFVDVVDDELAAASLYVHPAAIEAFGVSVVEAMRAGVPALVTETTGAASVVATVDEGMVVPPTPESLAAGVSAYFETDRDRREALSRASRDRSAEFTEETKTACFERQFADLLAEIAGSTRPAARSGRD